jgi:NAD(P)-dependent dehydrogenase (short-subunit alcohol dehydrogenase family)
MDTAIVTGASSALGLAISRKLIDIGFRVHGLGGDYTNCSLKNSAFIPTPCDLSDPNQLMQRVAAILEREDDVCLLVNNAKYAPPEEFAATSPAEIDRALRINLLAPLLLGRCLIESLRRSRGLVVNIAAATSLTARGGVIGAATTGGLRWAGEALFNEFREFGVRVTTIAPEPNRWRPEDCAPPRPGMPVMSQIDPAVVADAVAELVHNRHGNLVTELVLRPQRITEPKIDAVRRLPFPDPLPIPYTVPRAWIEAEELRDPEFPEETPAIIVNRKERRPKQQGPVVASARSFESDSFTDQPLEDERDYDEREDDQPDIDEDVVEPVPRSARLSALSTGRSEAAPPVSTDRDPAVSAEPGRRKKRRRRGRGKGGNPDGLRQPQGQAGSGQPQGPNPNAKPSQTPSQSQSGPRPAVHSKSPLSAQPSAQQQPQPSSGAQSGARPSAADTAAPAQRPVHQGMATPVSDSPVFPKKKSVRRGKRKPDDRQPTHMEAKPNAAPSGAPAGQAAPLAAPAQPQSPAPVAAVAGTPQPAADKPAAAKRPRSKPATAKPVASAPATGATPTGQSPADSPAGPARRPRGRSRSGPPKDGT